MMAEELPLADELSKYPVEEQETVLQSLQSHRQVGKSSQPNQHPVIVTYDSVSSHVSIQQSNSSNSPTVRTRSLLRPVTYTASSYVVTPQTTSNAGLPENLWSQELIRNLDLYRDDHGGWVSKEKAVADRQVGTDWRGLPIVYRGRGRPNKSMIGYLSQIPSCVDPVEADIIKRAVQDQIACTSDQESLVLPLPVQQYSADKIIIPKILPTAVTTESLQSPLHQDSLSDIESFNSEIHQVVEDAMSMDETSHIIDIEIKLENVRSENECRMIQAVQSLDSVEGQAIANEQPNPVQNLLVAKQTPHSKREHPNPTSKKSAESGSKKGTVNCPDCSATFRSVFKLRQHQVSPACPGFAVRCYICHARFEEDELLFSHELNDCMQVIPAQITSAPVDWGQWHLERYRCSLCSDQFANESSVLNHAKLEHPRHPPFHCRFCLQGYYSLRALNNHFNGTHSSSISNGYPCDKCKDSFSSEEFLARHQKDVHVGARLVLQCPHCSKTLASHKALRMHIAGQHDNNRPHLCMICNKTFVLAKTLDLHMKTHTGQKDHKCQQCGAAFIQKNRLLEHYSAHFNIRNFGCSICPKRFITKKELNNHLRTHSSIKAFRCQKCGKEFSQSQSLKKHDLSVHQTSDTFLYCVFCKRPFSSSHTLATHYRSFHCNLMKAKCTECSEVFFGEKDLNRHYHYRHLPSYSQPKGEETIAQAAISLGMKQPELVQKNSVVASAGTQNELYRCHTTSDCRLTFKVLKQLTVHSQQEHPNEKMIVEMVYETESDNETPVITEPLSTTSNTACHTSQHAVIIQPPST